MGASTIHYSYDNVGNRTAATDSTGTTTYTYDAGDQLQSATGPSGTTSYGFNANGDETSAGPWTYGFNLANQLTSASNGTTSVSYAYDGLGNQISATTGGATTNHLWDANGTLPQLILERDSLGNLIRRYAYGSGRISMTTPTTTAYYSSDPLGTVTDISGTGATLLGQYDNQPFGDGTTSSSVDPSVAGNPYAFTGEYQDPTTGLYDLRARQYDPATGRFLSPDPIMLDPNAGAYSYVSDNPLSYTDPSGMTRMPSCSLWCSVGGVVAHIPDDPGDFVASAACYSAAGVEARLVGKQTLAFWRSQGAEGLDGVTRVGHVGVQASPGGALIAATLLTCGRISKRFAKGIG